MKKEETPRRSSVSKDEDYEEKKEMRKGYDRAKKLLRRYVPIVRWLPKYSKFKALSDLIAGVTLGLTMIPQSIAYASLAGLTAQYGLYSSFVGCFVYAIFGTIKEVSIGTTSLMALVTVSYTRDMPIDFVILLTFITGIVQFFMGLLNLGFLVDFISMPVASGFTSATSIIIIVSQLRGLFGLSYKSGNVVDTIITFFRNIRSMRVADTILGFVCILFLLLFRKLKDLDNWQHVRGKSVNKKNSLGVVLKKTLWIVSISRNALVVLGASVVASKLQNESGVTPFLVTGKVASGLPDIALPPFSSQLGNETYNFIDMCRHLGFGMLMVPLVGVLTNVAIAKAFASEAPVEASQEMLTLGLCNLAGSFVSSIPTCGAFTRSAVSNASGIQTPFGGIYAGSLTLLALSFLTPYFGFIPKATLAAVLICAVIFLIDLSIFTFLWKGSKYDALAAMSTFFVCIIFNVEVGLFIGSILNAFYLLYLSARPNIQVLHQKTILGHKYLLVRPEIGLFYPAIDHLGSKITRLLRDCDYEKIPLIVDFGKLVGIDYTAIKGIERIILNIEKKGLQLFFINVSPHVKSKIVKLAKDAKNFRTIDDEATLIDIIESELSKCPTEPVITVVEEKAIPLLKMNSSLDSLNSPESKSLLANKTCDKSQDDTNKSIE